MGNTYFIIGHPVGLQVGGTLVELLTVLEAHTVHHQVIVEMTCIHMGGHHYLEGGEESLGQLQTDGMDLLGCHVLGGIEGLNELIEHPAVCFAVPLFGGHHFVVGRLGYAVPAGDQLPFFPQGFLFLLHIVQRSSQCSAALGRIFDGGECGHYLTSVVIWLTCSQIRA